MFTAAESTEPVRSSYIVRILVTYKTKETSSVVRNSMHEVITCFQFVIW